MSAARVSELDSIRGLAALVVVLHHCWQSILPDQNVFFPISLSHFPTDSLLLKLATIIALSPLKLLFSGHAAVGVFFVLSGFVLAKAVSSGNQTAYPAFLIRRICRIWLPFAASIFFAAALCQLANPAPINGHDWLNLSWAEPVTLKLVAGHLLMLGFPPYDVLNNPMWSLVHELRISIIFPFLAVATVARPKLVTILSVLAFLLLSAGRIVNPMVNLIHDDFFRGLCISWINTIRYTMFFVFGIILSIKSDEVGRIMKSRNWLKVCLWFVAAGLLAMPYVAGYIELGYAVGALILLGLTIHSTKAKVFLQQLPLRYLGKISYSFYLFHLIVLLAGVHLLYPSISLLWILAATPPASLLAASIFHHFIELPSNSLGKRLAGLMQ